MKCSPKAKRNTLRKAFTLMEMMLVMAIIAILAGGVISLTKDFSNTAKLQQANTDICTFNSHLLSYKTLAGRYPTSEQGLQALVTKPTSVPKPRQWSQSLKAVPNDPWDNAYIYKIPGSKDSSIYEIISTGPDGKMGTDDDISSQK